MSRASNSPQSRARHKKWIKRAKGYRGRRHRVFKLAKEAVLKAGQYRYRDRRQKKRVMRQKWQVHINAAARQNGISYSKFINQLKESNILIDRKILAQLAIEQPDTFSQIAKQSIKSK